MFSGINVLFAFTLRVANPTTFVMLLRRSPNCSDESNHLLMLAPCDPAKRAFINADWWLNIFPGLIRHCPEPLEDCGDKPSPELLPTFLKLPAEPVRSAPIPTCCSLRAGEKTGKLVSANRITQRLFAALFFTARWHLAFRWASHAHSRSRCFAGLDISADHPDPGRVHDTTHAAFLFAPATPSLLLWAFPSCIPQLFCYIRRALVAWSRDTLYRAQDMPRAR